MISSSSRYHPGLPTFNLPKCLLIPAACRSLLSMCSKERLRLCTKAAKLIILSCWYVSFPSNMPFSSRSFRKRLLLRNRFLRSCVLAVGKQLISALAPSAGVEYILQCLVFAMKTTHIFTIIDCHSLSDRLASYVSDSSVYNFCMYKPIIIVIITSHNLIACRLPKTTGPIIVKNLLCLTIQTVTLKKKENVFTSNLGNVLFVTWLL